MAKTFVSQFIQMISYGRCKAKCTSASSTSFPLPQRSRLHPLQTSFSWPKCYAINCGSCEMNS